MTRTRFHQARVAAGLSLQQVVNRLPAKVRVSRAALHKYETGASKPAAGMYHALAAIYGVRASSFLSEPAVSMEWAPLMRPRAVAARALHAFKARAAEQAERQIRVERLFPVSRLAKLPAGIAVGSLAQAEAAADRVRQSWRMGVGPLASLTDTIEYHGGIVVALPSAPPGFDSMRGASERGERVFVVLLDATPEQRRFDLACELGGFAMKFERRARVAPFIQRFASALLVPAESARRELGERRRRVTVEELEILRERYGVSEARWVSRATELGILPQGYRSTLPESHYPERGANQAPVVRDAERPRTRTERLLRIALDQRMVGPVNAEALLPGILSGAPPIRETGLSAGELLKLPRAERDAYMMKAAESAAHEYAPGGSLEILEAFGEKDLYDEQPEE